MNVPEHLISPLMFIITAVFLLLIPWHLKTIRLSYGGFQVQNNRFLRFLDGLQVVLLILSTLVLVLMASLVFTESVLHMFNVPH